MDEFTLKDLEMFKLEQKNILREMRGATGRGGHGPVIRQLLEKLTSVQILIARLEDVIEREPKKQDVKKVNKAAAPTKKAATK
jgi:hypothetical protein|tara:strand:+ start:170 stop:418 length:249 start_codon:yes stop_codon:yes gene_type:complete